MAFKYVALFALIAAASAQHYYEQPSVIKSYQPVVKQIVQPVIKKVVEHEEPANYEFEYAVKDEHTGDIKEQHETAKNGAVEGYYTLIDADGYRRIVHYTADDHHGFNAEVRREPVEGHKVVKQIVQPIVKKIVAQPIVHKYVQAQEQKYYSAPAQVHHYEAPAPQYYSAPAQVHHYAAPAPQYYSAPAPVKVEKYVAPVVQKVVAAPAKYASYENNHDFSSHVSFNGPSSNYHY